MRTSLIVPLVLLLLSPAQGSACALDGLRGGRFSPFHAMLSDPELPQPWSPATAPPSRQANERPEVTSPAPMVREIVADARGAPPPPRQATPN